MGSGYPSDEKCVAWLRAHVDPVFWLSKYCEVLLGWSWTRDLGRKRLRVLSGMRMRGHPLACKALLDFCNQQIKRGDVPNIFTSEG
ncbi:unnamed protein product [Heterosigma akashiwo]